MGRPRRAALLVQDRRGKDAGLEAESKEVSAVCGIVGYVGERPCRELLLKGLERLEYRGYDSAGLSLLADGQIDSVRAVGNLQFLKDAVEAQATAGSVATAESQATTGIGHTRWATHERVPEGNPHLHDDH